MQEKYFIKFIIRLINLSTNIVYKPCGIVDKSLSFVNIFQVFCGLVLNCVEK